MKLVLAAVAFVCAAAVMVPASALADMLPLLCPGSPIQLDGSKSTTAARITWQRKCDCCLEATGLGDGK